ncbi:MAG TPA: hypothetical protein PKC12_01115 [Thiobacillaceae bacterium]|mgnify:CR=1 FL=1|nr:hypothetical protein [Thiobacillaceae bacterium]
MPIRTLFAALALACAAFVFPAAGSAATANDIDRSAATQAEATQACLTKREGRHLAQIDCCKGHKGICGCRAGKIICCDGSASTEPGCTCRGDEPTADN